MAIWPDGQDASRERTGYDGDHGSGRGAALAPGGSAVPRLSEHRVTYDYYSILYLTSRFTRGLPKQEPLS
jgi:hypothetical protein